MKTILFIFGKVIQITLFVASVAAIFYSYKSIVVDNNSFQPFDFCTTLVTFAFFISIKTEIAKVFKKDKKISDVSAVFVDEVNSLHNKFQFIWIGWIPVGFMSFALFGTLLSIFGFDAWYKPYINFACVFPVMFLYSRLLSSYAENFKELKCPYCNGQFFKEFPTLLRRRKCNSCETRVDFY